MKKFPPPLDDLRVVPVLGVPVACVDYEGAREAVCRLARETRPTAVSACNTHLISVARHDPGFGLTLRSFDFIFPDSTVLKWTMNQFGAELEDRVYGPFFMRHMLQTCGPPWRHFFFGGSEECLRDLVNAAHALNPEVQIAGTCSPAFRPWTEDDEETFARQIRESGTDFIWVALGGERQENWIIRNRHRFDRGVFLAVGDAFRMLAGHVKPAPLWMQRAGLHWLYRMCQEPRRLWKRYFYHNSLYLLQLFSLHFQDERLEEPPAPESLRIAFLGARGVPARYAGFETVVQEVGGRLAQRGHQVFVYNRSQLYEQKPDSFLGMHVLYFPTLLRRNAETIVHTLLSSIHAITQPYDLIYLCGVGNACFAALLRASGKKILINVDGTDFKRSKWSGFARWWLFRSERWAVRLADCVIADNLQVVRHYVNLHGFRPEHLSYGAERIPVPEPSNGSELARLGLQKKGYLLYVGRLSPENEADLLLRAYARSARKIPLVLVGAAGYESAYERKLRKLATPGVIFAGAIYGSGYQELSRGCRCFVLPAAIEATRLVLLDQIGFGNAVIFREAPATREVIGDAGLPFGFTQPESELAEALDRVSQDDALCTQLGQLALARARQEFGWEKIMQRYEKLIFACIGGAAAEQKLRKMQAEG